MKADLIQALLNAAGLTALVGERIHWGMAPEETVTPYVVLTLVSARPEYVQKGRGGMTDYRIQADAYAETALAADDVAKAFVAAIEALPKPPFLGGFLITENSGLDVGAGRSVDQAATPLHRASLDVRVWRSDS